MDKDVVIQVEGLGKKYVLGQGGQPGRYTALRDVLAEAVKSPLRRLRQGASPAAPKKDNPEFWALRDVNLEVRRGEVVGIIGRNGAGKSTLLKILSRITEPTMGTVRIKGRVASLLEVGTGFHPELTGRENIYLNGAILGMSRAEIKAKFDEIVAFAEVERFLDTPVKRYSSGMYVRLAFAVAAHLEPEILIVDEVLAVGDVQFQNKCLGKIQQVANGEGRTVLFVSHNMQAISSLTSRCLLLKKGGCAFDGPTADAAAMYLKSFNTAQPIFTASASPSAPRVTRVEVLTSDPNGAHTCGAALQVSFEVNTPVKIRGACLSFQFVDEQQRPVVHLWTFDSEQPMCREPGVFKIICAVPQLRLYMGSYTMHVYFSEPPGGEIFQVLEHICPFQVNMSGQRREFEWRRGSCAYIEDASWKVTRRRREHNPVEG